MDKYRHCGGPKWKKKKKNGREDVLKIIAKHFPNEYDNIHEYKDDEIHEL